MRKVGSAAEATTPMNADASTKPDSITPIATPEQLTAAREARGWSMSDVAAKLGMMPRQIDAIEQGRWESLPGQAFIRGAVRAYGKALQVDVAPLLATLGVQATPELRPSSSLDSPLPRHGALGFDHGGSGSRIVWILLGVVGVIAIAMYFGRGADLGQVLDPGAGTQSGRSVDVLPLAPGSPSAGGDAATTPRVTGPSAGTGESTGAAAVAPAAGPSSATEGAGAASATGTASSSGSAAPAGSAAASSDGTGAGASSSPASGTAVSPSAPDDAASEPADAQSAVAAAEAAAAVEGSGAEGGVAPEGPVSAGSGGSTQATRADALVLRFERESWVEVRDATGRVLLLGTQPANSTRELSGEKPYSMTIGNAHFVRVEHGGRNVDLGAVTQKGVARVRVE